MNQSQQKRRLFGQQVTRHRLRSYYLHLLGFAANLWASSSYQQEVRTFLINHDLVFELWGIEYKHQHKEPESCASLTPKTSLEGGIVCMVAKGLLVEPRALNTQTQKLR